MGIIVERLSKVYLDYSVLKKNGNRCFKYKMCIKRVNYMRVFHMGWLYKIKIRKLTRRKQNLRIIITGILCIY